MEKLDFSNLKVMDVINDDPLEIQKPSEEKPIEKVTTQNEKPDEKIGKEERQEVLTEPPKTEEPEDEVETGEDSLIGFLSEKFGYDLGDDKFEDTPEGITDFVKTVASKQFEQYIDKLQDNYPDVVEYMEYRMNGGDPKAFYESLSKEIDYKQLQFGEEDTSTQKRVLRDFYSEQGFEQDTVDEMIKNYETSGILYNQAKAALPTLVKLKEKQKEQTLRQQEVQRIEYENQQKKQIELIQQTVQKGQLRDLKLSEADKGSFQNWLFKPVTKDGKTQQMLDREKLSIEDKLAIEYLIHKGFDINNLVTAKAKTLNVESIKSKMKGTQPVKLKSQEEQRKSKINLPNLSDLF